MSVDPYQYGDYNQPIDVLIETERFNTKKMGEEFKGFSWLTARYLHISYYSVSEDFTIQFIWKNSKDSSVFQSISYTVDKNENNFKQRLPSSLVCYEWQIRVIGTFTTEFELHGFLLDADPYLIGGRG